MRCSSAPNPTYAGGTGKTPLRDSAPDRRRKGFAVYEYEWWHLLIAIGHRRPSQNVRFETSRRTSDGGKAAGMSAPSARSAGAGDGHSGPGQIGAVASGAAGAGGSLRGMVAIAIPDDEEEGVMEAACQVRNFLFVLDPRTFRNVCKGPGGGDGDHDVSQIPGALNQRPERLTKGSKTTAGKVSLFRLGTGAWGRRMTKPLSG